MSRIQSACLFATLALSSCCTAPPSLDELDYPGTLQPPTNLPIEVVWQQTVTASWKQPGSDEVQERSFTAAVQRQGDKLTVLGLSPLGEVGFSIEQSADDIQVVNNIPEQMKIPPRFILLDVQRAFFPWLPQTTTSGKAVARLHGETISERGEGGRLVRRTFERDDRQPPGRIVIDYQWNEPTWHAPSRVVLQNNWFGYTLTIDTTAEHLLTK